MLSSISKVSASPTPKARAQMGAAHDDANASDDEWQGSRLQRVTSYRHILANMRHEREAQLGIVGRFGMPTVAAISAYWGMRVAMAAVNDGLGWKDAAGLGASIVLLGAAAGAIAQYNRRHAVLSNTHATYAQLERCRADLLRLDALDAREAAFLSAVEQEMSELRPFQQTQLVRRHSRV